YRLAQYALMKGQTKQARAYLASELQASPEDADTLVSMGSMFLMIDELDYATHCLLGVVDIDCANADGYYYLGLASAVKGQFEDAAEFFCHTLDIRPEHVPALRDSAVIYLAMGRLADAADRIKKALALAGDDSQLRSLNRRVSLAQTAERIVDFLCRLRPRLIFRKLLR
ncbi:unnamed protein product, partial [marine sediment metagenome]